MAARGPALVVLLVLVAGLSASEVAAAAAAARPPLPQVKLTEWPLRVIRPDPYTATAAAASAPEDRAGYITVGDSERQYFYYYFQAREPTGAAVALRSAPLMLWLNGGPGCSSLFGLFMENGPYTIARNASGGFVAVPADHSWTSVAHMLYLDQPVQTGFSYSKQADDMSTSMLDISLALLQFLTEFMGARPQLRSVPLYIGGESFAGQYLTSLGAMMLTYSPPARLNLKGLVFVNPFLDTMAMYNSYHPYSLSKKVISASRAAAIRSTLSKCVLELSLCEALDDGGLCDSAASTCEAGVMSPAMGRDGTNFYNYKAPCIGSMCYGTQEDLLEGYLNQPGVKQQWGVPPTLKFVLCTDPPFFALQYEKVRSRALLLPPLLEAGVRMLFMQGDLDLICNSLGVRKMLDQAAWSGQAAWAAAPSLPWSVGGRQQGMLKQVPGLALAQFTNAGHMVPMDQPQAALALLTRWMKMRPLQQ